jgi:hypothetical protein
MSQEYVTRKFTNKLLDLVNDEVLNKDTVIQMCLNYMSEADVQDMVESEGYDELFEDVY